MRNWKKLVLPVTLFAGMLLILPGCQAASAVDLSAIDAAVEDTEKTYCEIFQPEQISAEQWNSAVPWVRTYLLAADAVWAETCE